MTRDLQVRTRSFERTFRGPWRRETPSADGNDQGAWGTRSDPNAARISAREQLGLFPGREVAALVDLVEVSEVGVCLLDPAGGARKISPGNVVKPTGSLTSGGAWPAVRAAARPLSQYDRAAEAPVPVSQYSVMLSRMWSLVRLPAGCLSRKAREIL